MFTALREWKYFEKNASHASPYAVHLPTKAEVELLRRFDFDHSIQRMSVLMRDPSNKYYP